MKLEDQVCTFDQAKRLKELGINQNSLFSWFGDESVINEDAKTMTNPKWVFIELTNPVNAQALIDRQDRELDEPIASAFTVAELGVMLPQKVKYRGSDRDLRLSLNSVYYFDGINLDHIIRIDEFNTEAEARAAMLIYLLENKLITAEEVNEKLHI